MSDWETLLLLALAGIVVLFGLLWIIPRIAGRLTASYVNHARVLLLQGMPPGSVVRFLIDAGIQPALAVRLVAALQRELAEESRKAANL